MKTFCYKEYDGVFCSPITNQFHAPQFQCRKCAYLDSRIAKRSHELEAYAEQKKRVEGDAYFADGIFDIEVRAKSSLVDIHGYLDCVGPAIKLLREVGELAAYAEDKARDEEEAYAVVQLYDCLRAGLRPEISAITEAVTKVKDIARVKDVREGGQAKHLNGVMRPSGKYVVGAILELMHLFGITEEDLK